MSASNAPQSDSRTAGSNKGRVRAIEFARRAVKTPETVSPNYSRYIGRVGALAFAFGIGSAIAAMPVAFADETGSAGSTGVSSSDSNTSTKAPARRGGNRAPADKADSSSATPAATDPARSSAALTSAPRASITSARAAAASDGSDPVGGGLATWLATGSGAATSTAPRGGTRGTKVATSTTTGALEGAATARPIASADGFLGFFVGNGMADQPQWRHPLGNGYTWTGYAGVCTSGACTGGNGGITVTVAAALPAAMAVTRAGSAPVAPAALAWRASTVATVAVVVGGLFTGSGGDGGDGALRRTGR